MILADWFNWFNWFDWSYWSVGHGDDKFTKNLFCLCPLNNFSSEFQGLDGLFSGENFKWGASRYSVRISGRSIKLVQLL